MKIAMGLFIVLVVIRLVGVDYASAGVALVLVVVLTGVLVGFAEEALFRGIFLRCMRAGPHRSPRGTMDRRRLRAVPPTQPHRRVRNRAARHRSVLAVDQRRDALYLFRRNRGLILVAMIAHGIWDISTFLAGSHGADWAALLSFAIFPIGVIAAVVALVSVWRTDRHTIVTPSADRAPQHEQLTDRRAPVDHARLAAVRADR